MFTACPLFIRNGLIIYMYININKMTMCIHALSLHVTVYCCCFRDLKVIVMGDFNVGKTSFIGRYIEGEFKQHDAVRFLYILMKSKLVGNKSFFWKQPYKFLSNGLVLETQSVTQMAILLCYNSFAEQINSVWNHISLNYISVDYRYHETVH